MHPGRAWADKSTKDQKPKSQILEQINEHFCKFLPYRDIHQLFDRFVEDMRQLSHEEFVDDKDEVVVIAEERGAYQETLL